VVNRERDELKKIISTLTNQIGSLSLSSSTFNERLSDYAIKIRESAEINEIIKIKEKILKETEEIQKENRLTREAMATTEIHLQGASRRIEELEAELLKTQIEMMKDPLTQVYNRRAFDEKIKDQLNRFSRYNESFALLIFDMDHFKKINDTYGHTAGDIVLKTVASLAKDSIRAVDFLGRFGGEEYVIILDKVELSEAFTISEKIRTNIGSHEFLYKKQNVGVSVSIGVAVCKKEDSAESLLKRADEALYKAKDNGRNQTVKAE
jgi:diguanylate cyclase